MKNRKQMIKTDYRYIQQQTAINNACRKYGLIAYRPDYHAETNDYNTVLIYTAEAHKYNTELDREYKKKYRIFPDNSQYKKYILSLENTDRNGMFDFDFMNHGKIDLRGIHEEETIENVIREAAEAWQNEQAQTKN